MKPSDVVSDRDEPIPEDLLALIEAQLRTAGGPGSGNFGHKGRPGEIGGSGGGSDKPDPDPYPRGQYATEKPGVLRHTEEELLALHKEFEAAYASFDYPDIKTQTLFVIADARHHSHHASSFKDQVKTGDDVYTYVIDKVAPLLKEAGFPKVNSKAYHEVFKQFLFSLLPPLKERILGGPGSGNFGHTGRPGEVGGSGGGGGVDTSTGGGSGKGKGATNVTVEEDRYPIKKLTPEVFDAHFQGCSQDEIGKRMLADIPGSDWRATFMSTGEETDKIMYVATATDENSQITAKVTRDFQLDDKGRLTVNHHRMELKRTNAGDGKRILKEEFDLYEDLGVDLVTVEANIDIGGYAWARLGFEPAADKWTQHIARHVDKQVRTLPPALQAKVTPDLIALSAGEVGALKRLADHREEIDGQPLGKYLLRGSLWMGQLRLSDPKAKANLQRYFRG